MSSTYRRYYYVTPDISHWPRYDPETEQFYLQKPEGTELQTFLQWDPMLCCSEDEQNALSCVALFCDIEQIRGGKATTVNMKKKSVVRAEWRKESTESRLRTARSRAAHTWLLHNNETYKQLQEQHAKVLQEARTNAKHTWFIPTAFLLLHMEGVEVAARPVLYARSSFGDTDIKSRLSKLGHLLPHQLPSLKGSFMKKCSSRIYDYHRDFLLLCLLYDIGLARNLMQIVTIAEKKDMSADVAADHLHNFDSYWRQQQAILEDKCRQLDCLPKLFITVAPAEWKFPLHDSTMGCYQKDSKLSEGQGLLTLHFYQARIIV